VVWFSTEFWYGFQPVYTENTIIRTIRDDAFSFIRDHLAKSSERCTIKPDETADTAVNFFPLSAGFSGGSFIFLFYYGVK